MLVVVAIIMVLAALLLPAITKARARAVRAHCLSNIKQVDLILLMYGQDNNDRLPSTFTLRTFPPPLVDMVVKSHMDPEILFDPGYEDLWKSWYNSSSREIGYCLTLPGPTNLAPINVNSTIM